MRRLSAMRLGALFGALCVLGAGSAAGADPSAAEKERARAAWMDGMKARAGGQHEEALNHFLEAHRFMGLPATGFEVASEEETLGRLIEARDLALSVVKMEPKSASDSAYQARALALYERVGPRISTLQIRVSGPPPGALLHVRVDGEDVPAVAAALSRRVNPGKHTVTVSAPGFVSADKTVDVAESATLDVDLALTEETGTFDGATVFRPPPLLPAPLSRAVGPQPLWYSPADIAAASKPPPGRAPLVAGGLLIAAGSLGFGSGAVVALLTELAGRGPDVPAFGVIGASASLIVGGSLLVWHGRRLNRAALLKSKASSFQWTSLTLSPSIPGLDGETGIFVGLSGDLL